MFHLWESWLIHLVTIAGFLIVWLSGIYYLYRLTPSIVGLSLCLAFVAGWIWMPPHVCKREHIPWLPIPPRTFLWIFGSIAASCITIAVLWISRTESGVVSPWQVVPGLVFFAYFLSAIFTVRTAMTAELRWSMPVMMLFAFATFGVSFLVYRLGFGYESFWHQAAEQELFENGSVLPRQVLHLGQYISVVSLAWLSKLSIHRLDRALVPLLSSFVMIPLVVTAFRYGWMKRFEKPALVVIALILIPFTYFTFTVPFNLAFIFFTLIVAFMPLSEQPRIRWFLIAMAGAALVTDPIVGLPATALLFVRLIRRPWAALPVVAVAIGAASIIHAGQLSWMTPTYGRLFEGLNNLFGNVYNLKEGQPYLSIFYSFIYAAPLVLIGLSVYGYVHQLKKQNEFLSAVRLLAYTSFAIVIGSIVVPFLIADSAKRHELAALALGMFVVCWLPGIAYAVHRLMEIKAPLRQGICSVMIAVILTSVWFVSYPQDNEIVPLAAPSVSREDLDAVEFIEGNAQGVLYAVLAPQAAGAAALMDFGVRKQVPSRDGRIFAYSIPTNETMHSFYVRLILTDEDPKQVHSELNRFVDVPFTYVIVPASEDPDGRIVKRLEPITLTAYRIGGNQILKLKAVARE